MATEREGRDEFQGGEIGEGRGRAVDRGGEPRYGGAPRDSDAGVSGYDDSFEGGSAADDAEGGQRRRPGGARDEGAQFDEDRFTRQLGMHGGAMGGGSGDGYLGQAHENDPDAGTVGEENTGGGDVGRSRGPADGLRGGASDEDRNGG